jgi:hypothetical protein
MQDPRIVQDWILFWRKLDSTRLITWMHKMKIHVLSVSNLGEYMWATSMKTRWLQRYCKKLNLEGKFVAKLNWDPRHKNVWKLETQTLTSALEGSELLVSHPGRINPTKISIGTKYIRGLAGSWVGNERGYKEQSACHCKQSHLHLLTCNLSHSHEVTPVKGRNKLTNRKDVLLNSCFLQLISSCYFVKSF